MRAWLIPHLSLLLILLGYSEAVSRKRFKSRPLVPFGSQAPNLDELDERAAGALTQPISAASPALRRLVRNDNADIEFADEEMEKQPRPAKSYEDHYATLACSARLDHLAWLVKRRWPGVFLRVLEAWDQERRHGPASLHYEGRAFDLATSELSRAPLNELGGLALRAGFHFVAHHSRDYIHVACRRAWRRLQAV